MFSCILLLILSFISGPLCSHFYSQEYGYGDEDGDEIDLGIEYMSMSNTATAGGVQGSSPRGQQSAYYRGGRGGSRGM